MKLLLLDQSYTFENNEKGIQELIDKINTTLADNNVFISHLVIDGQDIYEDHENYILDNINNIEEVVTVTKTIKQIIDDLLVSLNDYTTRGIPEIEKLINEFYQTPSENSWLTLNQLLEGVDWIYQTVKNIDLTEHTIANWNEFIKCTATFEVELPNLLEAMENKDTILIADIIQYEILPQFEIINAETEKNFEVK